MTKATRHMRRTRKTRRTRRTARRYRGGGDDEDRHAFFQWVNSQKRVPVSNGEEIVRIAVTRGMKEHGLSQEAADGLMTAYRTRDPTQRDALVEVLVKFAGVGRDRAKEIVGG